MKFGMKQFFFLITFFGLMNKGFAQKDSTIQIQYMLHADMYYSYDFQKPFNNRKPDYIYNHARHNEINANLILGKIGLNFNNKARANLGVMAGNYAQYNLATEPSWAGNIFEANIGVKVSTKENIWVDAGIMPSHIGFESAISSDCYTLTRSIAAENSPYYEAGAKISYGSKNEKFSASLLYLNGWQRIQKLPGYKKPSVGMQLVYKLHPNITINYSNFLGTNQPDSAKAFRTFHNFYIIHEKLKRLNFILGVDIGTDKNSLGKSVKWYTPQFIIKYIGNIKNSISGRVEYYNDKNEIIIPTTIGQGFKVFGLSLNHDYKINSNLMWRNEIKYFKATTSIFNNNADNNLNFTSSLALKW
jgi:hypothetical protein